MTQLFEEQNRRAEILASTAEDLFDSPVVKLLQKELKLSSSYYQGEMLLEYLLCFYLYPNTEGQGWLERMLRPALYKGKEELIYRLCTIPVDELKYPIDETKEEKLTPENLIDGWVLVVQYLANSCLITDEIIKGIQQNPKLIIENVPKDFKWKDTQYETVNLWHRFERLTVRGTTTKHPTKINNIQYYRKFEWETQPMATILTLLTMNIRFIFNDINLELRSLNNLTHWILFWKKLIFGTGTGGVRSVNLIEAEKKCIPLKENWLLVILSELRNGL